MDDETADYWFGDHIRDDLDQAIEAARPFVYSTKDQLEEALGHANRTAKRAPHVLGTARYPSKWDDAHRFIDELLNDLKGR